MEKKGNFFVTLIFILLTIVLAGFIVYDKFINTNDKQTCDTNKNQEVKENIKGSKSFKDVAFKYEVVYSNLKNKAYETNNYKITLTLNLYNDGTFTYDTINDVHSGTIGNYIIDNDKIILTNWFYTGNGTGVEPASGTQTLNIDNNGNIIDSSSDIAILKENNITNIKLEKKGTSDKFDLYKKITEEP